MSQIVPTISFSLYRNPYQGAHMSFRPALLHGRWRGWGVGDQEVTTPRVESGFRVAGSVFGLCNPDLVIPCQCLRAGAGARLRGHLAVSCKPWLEKARAGLAVQVPPGRLEHVACFAHTSAAKDNWLQKGPVIAHVRHRSDTTEFSFSSCHGRGLPTCGIMRRVALLTSWRI